MTKTVYIDTSVVGGYFDKEFEHWTRAFFESVKKGQFKLAVSELLYTELAEAPAAVRAFLAKIPEEHKVQALYNREARDLAAQYVQANIVGHTSLADCRHIAIATLNEVDILTSWNFKHIVNLNKIHLYNGVNLQNGYRTIEIRTPREILSYED